MNAIRATNAYRTVGVHSAIDDASPHRLIAMLLDGALDRIAAARGAMERGEIRQQGMLLGQAISIVDSLRASLDHTVGGELAGNLADLYDYSERRLLEARTQGDTAILDEVAGLLREIKSGWDEIPDQFR